MFAFAKVYMLLDASPGAFSLKVLRSRSTDIVKILGIKMTKDLKWGVHIGDVIKRASGRLFMLSILYTIWLIY